MEKKLIKIAGAGISGLTAAINLAKAGYNVEIYDAGKDSGHRFHGDFQGIENWSYKQDVLDFLKDINIELNFDYQGVNKLSIWAPNKCHKDFKLSRPLYYLVKRGTEEDCLDQRLKKQALANGVKISYNHPVEPKDVNIIATGPFFNDPDTDAMASGYVFKTDLKDTNIGILDDRYALDGYSYFLVHNGEATIAACIFDNYKKLNEYREKTLELCKQNKNFKMNDVKKFSGVGNFFLQKKSKDNKIYIGEAGGFQDALWGFGMRYAMKSGYYAAVSIIKNKNFYRLCKKDIIPKLKTSIINRIFFKMLNNKSYRWLVEHYTKRIDDPIEFARKFYNPSVVKKLLFPFAKIILRKHIKDPRNF